MKTTTKTKTTRRKKTIEKPTELAPAPTETTASRPTITQPSIDPEREELAYDDQRAESYVRKTPLGMLEEAEAEADQRELADYRDAISTLRQKGFSFREIAEFLTKRGVFADKNAVYRVYTKFMTPEEIEAEAEMAEEEKNRAVE